jgi:hypothetical protein
MHPAKPMTANESVMTAHEPETTPGATTAAPPYADAHSAVFSEGDEPTYALVGEILHVTDDAGATTQHLLAGQGLMYPIDEDLLPVFEFFKTARAEHQAQEWLDWAGAPAGFLKHIVKLRILVRVDPRTSWTGAKSLKGLRLTAQSTQGETHENGYISVMSQAGDLVMVVSPELATLLWGNEEGWDIPAAIKRMAKLSGLDKEVIARRVLAMTPMLLEYGYARLEWLKVPKA